MPEEKDIQQEILQEIEGTLGADLGAAGTRERSQLPDCECVLKITNTYFNRSRQKQRKQLVAVCEIIQCDVGDEFIGKNYYKTWGLENKENLQWLNTDMENLDFPVPQSAVDLAKVKEKLVGVVFSATLRANSDPQYAPNCYINEGARRTDLEDQSASDDGVLY